MAINELTLYLCAAFQKMKAFVVFLAYRHAITILQRELKLGLQLEL
jgi:hypothetical protein